VVSLDGWESKNFSAATARQSPYFDALKLRAPYLLFLQDKPPNPGLQFDAAFFHSLKYAERYFYQVNQLEHAAYVANPLALPLLDATKRTGVEFVYQSVLYFLNAYVKKDARSLAWLKRSAEANGFSKELLKAETKLPALPPAPTAAEFEQLLGVGLGQDGSSLTRGIEVFRAAKKADPELTLFSVPGINMFAFRMKRQNKPEAALALLKLGVEAYPQSATALDNLGSAYLEFGRPERALECFTQALALVADDPDLNEGEKAQFRNELQQKFNRLKGAK
ncbi:MAG TPA: tetratricopeptide repeat protein, partial [Blastocatellia bacterium]|nr:tetratricopeptide repeat protein [Blastocatellia bacterium]